MVNQIVDKQNKYSWYGKKSFVFLLWLVAVISALIYVGKRFYMGPAPIETNLLAMLPMDQRRPAAEQAVARLVEFSGGRLVMLIGHKEAAQAQKAAAQTVALFRQSGVFEQIQGPVGKIDLRQVLSGYKRYRIGLLTKEDEVALSTNASLWLEQKITQRLMFPVQGSIGLGIDEDPFGFFNRVLMNLPFSTQKIREEKGWLTAEGDGESWVLLSAKVKGSVYIPAVQDRVMAVLNEVQRKVRPFETKPGKEGGPLHVMCTGGVLFASAARAHAEAEMSLISLVSMVGVLVIMVWVFRSLRHLALACVALVAGMAVATAVTLGYFHQLNLLTLVMGASLIGVAIDYPIQLFAFQMESGRNWNVETGLWRVRGALGLGLLTSLVGFGSLWVLPFPGLRQIAMFSCVGLIVALWSVFACYPLFLKQPLHIGNSAALKVPGNVLTVYHRLFSGKQGVMLLGVGLALALPGIIRVHSNDDVHQLIQPEQHLLQDEERIRHLTGQSINNQFYLIQGEDEEQLLERSQGLLKRLAVFKDKHELEGYQAIASFVPPRYEQNKHLQLIYSQLVLSGQAERILRKAGIKEQIIQRYLAELKTAPTQSLDIKTWLTLPISFPYRHLWLGKINGLYATVVIPQGSQSLESLEHAALGLEGVTWVDKAGSVSSLFRQFRETGTHMFWLAVVLTGGVLWWRYSWRTACIMIGLILSVVWMTLGALGWIGIPLNVFVSLAFMLILGVGLDYTIFLQEAREHDRAALLGVSLSAVMTLLSFGLLFFSSMPAVRGFGLTLLIGVTLALLTSPLVRVWSAEKIRLT